VEIERKFLVDEPPDAAQLGTGESIRQGYVAAEEAVSVRVRITDREAWLTVKAGGGVARTEVELPLSEEQADALWPHTEGRRIVKRRHRVALDGDDVAELDVYAGALDGLITVEVEFDDEAAADAFEPPAWFGREVTHESGWSNLSLSEHGRPD
jgi:CYTH domain-containing protein